MSTRCDAWYVEGEWSVSYDFSMGDRFEEGPAIYVDGPGIHIELKCWDLEKEDFLSEKAPVRAWGEGGDPADWQLGLTQILPVGVVGAIAKRRAMFLHNLRTDGKPVEPLP